MQSYSSGFQKNFSKSYMSGWARCWVQHKFSPDLFQMPQRVISSLNLFDQTVVVLLVHAISKRAFGLQNSHIARFSFAPFISSRCVVCTSWTVNHMEQAPILIIAMVVTSFWNFFQFHISSFESLLTNK